MNEWNVKSSKCSTNTINPIRKTVENMKATPNPNKKPIPLSIGDPTIFGNFQPPQSAVESIIKAVKSGTNNGYGPSNGSKEAREAVAKFISEENAVVTSDDVFLACGCSDALNLSITVLANPGDNIIMPRPGFSIYKTFCGSLDVEARYYNCLPEKSWEADLEDLKAKIDNKTRAIIILNPSNPCGSNFSKEHILDILKVAEKYKLPIISDEIYADMVFSGNKFYSVASLSKNVPVLQCGGIAKKFLVPGWRCGWVVVHDVNEIFGANIRNGLFQLSQRILGPCTLVQAALPDILNNTSSEFHDNTMKKLERGAMTAYTGISKIKGLNPVQPGAAMYMMVGFNPDNFPSIKDDIEFSEMLVTEQSVMCLPGSCFDYPNFVRLVLTVPEELILEACQRINEFCEKYFVP